MQTPGAHASSHFDGSFLADRRYEADEVRTSTVDRQSRPESVTEKIERPFREGPLTVCVFAVDDLGLVRMQSQPALRQPLFKRQTQVLRLCFASTMADSVICVAFELHVWIFPAHPEIEYWANNCPLWRALFPMDQ